MEKIVECKEYKNGWAIKTERKEYKIFCDSFRSKFMCPENIVGRVVSKRSPYTVGTSIHLPTTRQDISFVFWGGEGIHFEVNDL